MDSYARPLKSPISLLRNTDSRRHTSTLSGVINIYTQIHLVNLLAFALCRSQVLILSLMQAGVDSWERSNPNGIYERLRTYRTLILYPGLHLRRDLVLLQGESIM